MTVDEITVETLGVQLMEAREELATLKADIEPMAKEMFTMADRLDGVNTVLHHVQDRAIERLQNDEYNALPNEASLGIIATDLTRAFQAIAKLTNAAFDTEDE